MCAIRQSAVLIAERESSVVSRETQQLQLAWHSRHRITYQRVLGGWKRETYWWRANNWEREGGGERERERERERKTETETERERARPRPGSIHL